MKLLSRLLIAKLLTIIHILIVWGPLMLRVIFYNVTKYDIYLMLFILSIRLHWIFFKGECIISYFEKKIVKPTYKMGEEIYSSPYLDLIYKNRKISKDQISRYYQDFTENLVIFFILFTNIKSENFNLILVLSLISIILFMCSNFSYRDHLKKRLSQNENTISDLNIYK